LTCFGNGRVYLLDGEGRERFSVPNNSTFSLECVSDDRFIVHNHGKDYMVDGKGNVVLEKESEKYAYHDIYPIPFGNMLHECYRLENFKGPLHTILSLDGEVLIEGLAQIYAYGETCLYVRTGYSAGLMDYHGNWIWKRSAFRKLMD